MIFGTVLQTFLNVYKLSRENYDYYQFSNNQITLKTMILMTNMKRNLIMKDVFAIKNNPHIYEHCSKDLEKLIQLQFDLKINLTDFDAIHHL